MEISATGSPSLFISSGKWTKFVGKKCTLGKNVFILVEINIHVKLFFLYAINPFFVSVKTSKHNGFHLQDYGGEALNG